MSTLKLSVDYPQAMKYLSGNDTEGGNRMNESKTTTPTIGMTIDEVAQALRVDEKTVRKLIKEEGLPARIVGRGYRIEEGALKKWLAGKQKETIDSLFEEFKANPMAAADRILSGLATVTGSTKDDLRLQLDKCLHPEDYEDDGGKTS